MTARATLLYRLFSPVPPSSRSILLFLAVSISTSATFPLSSSPPSSILSPSIQVAMATRTTSSTLDSSRSSTSDTGSSNDINNRSSSSGKGKTIYLIRHAETEENVRMFALQEVGKSLKNGYLPKKADVAYGCSFVGMQIANKKDSVLSEFGMAQVRELHKVLLQEQQQQKKKHWVHDLDLIAYSPLQRARETCMGTFGIPSNTMEMDDTEATKPIVTPLRSTFPPLVQLDCLVEVTPWESIFGGAKKAIRGRIKELEDWIESQNDDEVSTIAIVGHSEYFQMMLEEAGMEKKPMNCDVWKATYYPGGKWTDLSLIHRLLSPTTPTTETKTDTDAVATDVITNSKDPVASSNSQ